MSDPTTDEPVVDPEEQPGTDPSQTPPENPSGEGAEPDGVTPVTPQPAA